MATKVELLQLSPTMTVGTLVKWRVKEGDTVKVGDIIAEIETDKAVMDHETFDAGTVLKLLVPEGGKVPVGGSLMIVGKAGEDISALAAAAPAPAPAAAAPAAPKPAAPPAPAPAPKPAPAPAPAPIAVAPKPAPAPAPAANGNGGGRVIASPLAKRIAKESGLDIAQLTGSAPGGRIVKRDVETALAGGLATAKPTAPAYVAGPAAEIVELPVSNIRRITAERLTYSKNTIPHFQLDILVRAERLLEWQDRMRKANPDVKVTVTHLLLKAMAILAMKHQPIRTQWGGDVLRVIPAGHISCAVATDEGLLTPVIRDAHAKSVLQIAADLADLSARAKSRRLKPEEMTGGVQTLSNLGMFPIHFFTAIINPPESSILAVGTVEERVFVENGEMKAGKAFNITMSCDHRIIDGAVGAAYLKDLKAALEDPLLLL